MVQTSIRIFSKPASFTRRSPIIATHCLCQDLPFRKFREVKIYQYYLEILLPDKLLG